MSQILSESTKRKAISSFLIFWILFQLFCGFRSVITQEIRFGWGMFTAAFLYRIRVYGIDHEGEKYRVRNREYRPWVRGRSYSHLKQRKHLRGYWSGPFSFSKKIDHFGQELCRHEPTNQYQKIKIEIRRVPIDRDESGIYDDVREYICSKEN